MDFLDIFTDQELQAIVEATKGNPAYCQSCYHEIHDGTCPACEEYGGECPE